MEFIIVKVIHQADGLFEVLINGVASGKKTGEKIILGDSGYVYIAAAGSGMKEMLVDVQNTTEIHPMIIELKEAAI